MTTTTHATLYINAAVEIPLGAVMVRSALGRNEDGWTIDQGMFYYYENRAEAEAARAKLAAIPRLECTIKEWASHDGDRDAPDAG